METTTGRTLDDIEAALDRISGLESRLAATKLRLLREADRMQARLVDGARTMADWIAARLDVSPDTARTLITTARSLEDAPDLETGLEAGTVSFDRTVELARARAAGVDVDDHAGFDVAGLQQVIARRRRRTPSSDRESFDARYLVIQPSLDHRVWRLHGRLAGTDGAAVEKALDRRADQITRGVDRRPPLARRRADALVDLCHTSSGTSGSTSEPLVTVFVDTHGATINGYLPVGTDTLDEALCTGSLEVIDLTDPGTPLARGHTSRVIPRKLRRAVFWRDGGRCAIDGCSSRYRIQPHHIIPRAHHGEHQLDNLVTLCWYHHHIVVHGHGRHIDPDSPPQRRRFLTTPERAPPH